MPAPRKSQDQLALSGQLSHNPKKYENRNPIDIIEPCGDPPRMLDKKFHDAWYEITDTNTYLTKGDRIMVEMAAVMITQWRNCVLTPSEVGRLVTIMSKLGMSPKDRAQIDAPTSAATTNPWGAFN